MGSRQFRQRRCRRLGLGAAEADTLILSEAFARITVCEDYVEAPDCSIGIAAAEVVAALRKRPASTLPAHHIS